eukprot:scaffold1616_cov395-Prasinococcus_capsulatus_cf.AAC.7
MPVSDARAETLRQPCRASGRGHCGGVRATGERAHEAHVHRHRPRVAIGPGRGPCRLYCCNFTRTA